VLLLLCPFYLELLLANFALAIVIVYR